MATHSWQNIYHCSRRPFYILPEPLLGLLHLSLISTVYSFVVKLSWTPLERPCDACTHVKVIQLSQYMEHMTRTST